MKDNSIFTSEDVLEATANDLPQLSDELRRKVFAAVKRERDTQVRRRRMVIAACVFPLLFVGVWNLSAFLILSWMRGPAPTAADLASQGPLSQPAYPLGKASILPVRFLDPDQLFESAEFALTYPTPEWELVDEQFRVRDRNSHISEHWVSTRN